jgi:nucleoside-diphosphate-sugar epimerase
MSVYLVTGIAGFIASKVAELLLQAGHFVVGVDNLNEYYDVRLKYSRLDNLRRAGGKCLSFNQLDIEDFSGLKCLFDKYEFDAVLHLAARAGVRASMDNPLVYVSTNVMGTSHLLECVRERATTRFVLASTSSLYSGQPMPFREDSAANTPLSPYAASKKAAEAMAYSYHKLYGMDVSILRYFTVFGPAGRPDMSIFKFIEKIACGVPLEIYGDGTQSRDFTYVDDIARGTIAAMEKTQGYEIINLGGGNPPISLNRTIALVEDALGKKAVRREMPFSKGDMNVTMADISKAGRLLAWTPQVAFADGLRHTVEWHQANSKWLRHAVA